MSDLFLKEFYDSVRDPSWPDINNWIDFENLDSGVKQECFKVHGLQHRLDQINNADYWAGRMKVLRHQDLFFIPVPKCASTYYLDLFENQLGWEESSLDQINFDQDLAFGTLMHPVTRCLKGQAQWLWQVVRQLDCFQTLHFDEYFKIITEDLLIPDLHSLPYNITFGKYLDKIHWIPMDLLDDRQTKIHMMELFASRGHSISLPLDDERTHQSQPLKLKFYQTLHQIYFQKTKKSYFLQLLLSADLAFYQQLISQYQKKAALA
jgi:hypothetical protein